jgi:hypothetical protein
MRPPTLDRNSWGVEGAGSGLGLRPHVQLGSASNASAGLDIAMYFFELISPFFPQEMFLVGPDKEVAASFYRGRYLMEISRPYCIPRFQFAKLPSKKVNSGWSSCSYISARAVTRGLLASRLRKMDEVRSHGREHAQLHSVRDG